MGKSWRRERTDHGQRNRELQEQQPRVSLDLSSLDDEGDLDYSDSPVYPESKEQEHA